MPNATQTTASIQSERAAELDTATIRATAFATWAEFLDACEKGWAPTIVVALDDGHLVAEAKRELRQELQARGLRVYPVLAAVL